MSAKVLRPQFGNQGRGRAASARAAQAIELEKRVDARRAEKLSAADRVIIARNLGRLLQKHRKTRGLLSDLLRAAKPTTGKADYTKHLKRYVAFGEEEPSSPKLLAARIDIYRDLAKEAAKRGLLGFCTESDFWIELLADTSFSSPSSAPSVLSDPGIRDLAESFAPLFEMLKAIGEAVRQQFRVDDCFQRIARWRFLSGNGGAALVSEDHPAGPEKHDPDFWAERIDLLPLVEVAPMNYRAERVGAASLRVMDAPNPMELEVRVSSGVWFGLWPEPPQLVATPVLVWLDTATLVKSTAHKDESGWSDYEVEFPIPPNSPIHSGDEQNVILLSENADEELRGRLTLDEGASRAMTRLLPQVFEPARLSLDSLFHLLHGRLSDEQRDAAREALGLDFLGEVHAYPGTVAAHLERSLRYRDIDDPDRLDNRLRALANRLCAAVVDREREVQSILEDRTNAFIEQQRALASRGEE